MKTEALHDVRLTPGSAIGLFACLRVGEVLAAFLILAVANWVAPVNIHFGPWVSAYAILLWEYALWQYGLVSVLAWAVYFGVSRMRLRIAPTAAFNALLHPAFLAAWQWQYDGPGNGFGATLWCSALALAVFDFLNALLVVRWLLRRRARRSMARPPAGG